MRRKIKLGCRVAAVLVSFLGVGCGSDDVRHPSAPTFADGFIVGINYPWLNYGHDFGDAWGHQGVSVNQSEVSSDLETLKLNGIDMVRWFMLADGRAAPEFSDSMVVGIDDFFINDVEAMLDLAHQNGQRVIITIFDYLWFESPIVVDGVQLGGRGDILVDPAGSASFFEQCLGPLVDAIGNHPAIFAWDIINEPEWSIADKSPIVGEPISYFQMSRFISDTADFLHARSSHPVTLGSADLDSMLSLWADVDLDFLQFHAYGDWPQVPWEEMGVETPVLMGEFSTATSAEDVEASVIEAYNLGYAGVLGWSFRAADDETNQAAALEGLSLGRSALETLDTHP